MAENPSSPHPPIIRWVLMPAILATAGALAAVTGYEENFPVPRVVQYGFAGAGYALGVAMAVACFRSTLLRCLTAPMLTLFGLSMSIALNDARVGLGPANVWSVLPRFLGLQTLPLLILPSAAIAYAHSRLLEPEGMRWRFARALVFYPIASGLAGFVAVLIADAWRENLVEFFAVLGASQALGMLAVLKISTALARRT